MGTVSGSGRYRKGSVITISATPNNGYEFSHWSDGSYERERQITITSDISLTAFFKAQEHRGILTYVPNKDYVNPQS